jgi:hypothetical protein
VYPRGDCYTSNKVAKSLLEFSTSIPRNQLRPSYGEGFLGAPIQIGMRRQAPPPPAQGEARGSSKSSPPQTREIHITFEPRRLSPAWVAQAYEQLIPIVRHPTSMSPSPGRDRLESGETGSVGRAASSRE